jgi:predicted transposase/invertase (TIGR01784 family)
MEGAIKWCIGEGILKGFFETHGTEVVNMLMTEWKLEEALAVEWEEGREKGLEEGLEKGREEGLEKGLEEGLEKGREEAARKALARGVSLDIIREITGLDEETIARLSQN